MQNQGALHVGRKIRMQSGSIVKEVEVIVLTDTYVEVGFIEDGEQLSIRFAQDGTQLGHRTEWCNPPELMSGLLGT